MSKELFLVLANIFYTNRDEIQDIKDAYQRFNGTTISDPLSSEKFTTVLKEIGGEFSSKEGLYGVIDVLLLKNV